ncbi:aminoglycoside phosphotransferase family protein [Actinopolymorpha alba]|uniref:aminoglycoside phosphotransferase family protein n=1 Tax=Actinopolymorpha alba TaxID=533267 RepID=UPI00037C25E4|nr:aminoglycoside phosphotransferase family protein [Actinopolymorpha alba]
MRKPDVNFVALEDLLVRVFGSREQLAFERTPSGSSTQVYRVIRGAETFYVRIAEGPEDSLAPEAELHRVLHESGVRVPQVVHYEPFDVRLARSVMVTTEVAGQPLSATPQADAPADIGRAAGRDLARIHSIPVQGFGWIRRKHQSDSWPLRGQHPTYAEYVAPSSVGGPLVEIGFHLDQADQAVRLLEEAIELRPSDAVGSVAHGDFDASQIFESDGMYTGLIDFGNIRGTDYTFDFATMCLNAEPARRLHRQLTQGYSEIRPLPEDHQRRLYLACVLSATHRLSHWFERDGHAAANGRAFRWIRDRLNDLLTSGQAPTPR